PPPVYNATGSHGTKQGRVKQWVLEPNQTAPRAASTRSMKLRHFSGFRGDPHMRQQNEEKSRRSVSAAGCSCHARLSIDCCQPAGAREGKRGRRILSGPSRSRPPMQCQSRHAQRAPPSGERHIDEDATSNEEENVDEYRLCKNNRTANNS